MACGESKEPNFSLSLGHHDKERTIKGENDTKNILISDISEIIPVSFKNSTQNEVTIP